MAQVGLQRTVTEHNFLLHVLQTTAPVQLPAFPELCGEHLLCIRKDSQEEKEP